MPTTAEPEAAPLMIDDYAQASGTAAGAAERFGRKDLIRFPLLVAAIVGAILIMGVLGYSLIRQFRFIQIYNAGQAGSVYVEGFLAPHARTFFRNGTFPPQMHDEVRELLRRMPAARHFDALKIWTPNGDLIFTTLEPGDIHDEDHTDLQRAAQGELVTELSLPGKEDAGPGPILEIYSPIIDPATGRVVAVGEIYQDATTLLAERIMIERSIWIAVGFTTVGMMGLLLLVAYQRRELERRFSEEHKIATENRVLRIEADRARLSASEANERLLNNVGAELHDGPIQLVSLLMLASEDESRLPTSKAELLHQVLTDLRSISSGLILPEVHDLNLEQTLRLAIERHQSLTGCVVDTRIDALPEDVNEPLRICLYRAVQEGLNNSWRYAAGRGNAVEARQDGDSIVVIVRDSGPAEGAKSVQGDRTGTTAIRAHLGHLGIRNRLEAFGGTLAFHSIPAVGTELVARVPWQPQSSS